jgi:geranylgeranyl diphosphate synthase type I
VNELFEIPVVQNAIEEELKECIHYSQNNAYKLYEEMFTYQMDWEISSHTARGKRVRPLLLLSATYAAGGEWQKALPAAASLELMHNFSLIHDDIQDQSTTRRGKDTIWVKWGQPQAINSGDAMLTLSSLAVHRLSISFPADLVLHVDDCIHSACLELTRGQFLDISFETREIVSVEEYTQMIQGKTCALLSAALEIGGILAGVNQKNQALLSQCGNLLGQAYQVQDDWLGIWGNDALTGKSTQSDLLTRKKTYPILLGLSKKAHFSRLWNEISLIQPNNIPEMIRALEDDGVKSETEYRMQILYNQTQDTLNSLSLNPSRISPLRNLIDKLVKRVQ